MELATHKCAIVANEVSQGLGRSLWKPLPLTKFFCALDRTLVFDTFELWIRKLVAGTNNGTHVFSYFPLQPSVFLLQDSHFWEAY